MKQCSRASEWFARMDSLRELVFLFILNQCVSGIQIWTPKCTRIERALLALHSLVQCMCMRVSHSRGKRPHKLRRDTALCGHTLAALAAAQSHFVPSSLHRLLLPKAPKLTCLVGSYDTFWGFMRGKRGKVAHTFFIARSICTHRKRIITPTTIVQN